MTKQHIKRIAAPKSWPIKRKGAKWVTRPLPGAHSFKLGTALVTIMKDVLKLAKTSKEARNIIRNQEVLVNGVAVKELRFNVGVFDVIELPMIKKAYRVMLNTKGKLSSIEIGSEEKNLRPCKVVGKTKLKEGRTQVNLDNGTNIIVEKDNFSTHDLVLLTLPKKEVKEHVKLEKGVTVYLVRGKHTGKTGVVEEVSDDNIILKTESGDTIQTPKEFTFVIGKDKPLIALNSDGKAKGKTK